MAKANLRSYTPEFREEAVKTILAQGLSLEEAGRRLAVPKGHVGQLDGRCKAWHACSNSTRQPHRSGVGSRSGEAAQESRRSMY